MTTVTLGVPGQIMPPADRAVALAQRAESDGFDAVWWPSHLMGWIPDSVWTEDLTPLAASQSNPHVHFDPFAMMGAVGAVTERIRVGVVVSDVIGRHPAMLAQTALTVDHLARGRSILGLGSGERLNVTPYGMEWRRPVARLSEALRVMRLLWTADGPVDFDGEFFRLERAVLGLQPYEGAPPPIWLASHGPRMLELCGREGDGWLPTKMEPEEYAAKLGAIRQAAEAAGRDPEAITPSMLGYVLAAPGEETLERLCAQPLLRMLGVAMFLPDEVYERYGATPPFGGKTGFHAFMPTTVSRQEAERVLDHFPPAMARYLTFHGDARQIAAQIGAYVDAGLRDLIMWNVTAFADPSLAGYSFEVLREVRERLHGAPATL